MRPATSGWVSVVLIAGPILWVAALIVVAFALKYGTVVEIALAVVVVSFLVAMVVLDPGAGAAGPRGGGLLMLRLCTQILLAFVALYPIVSVGLLDRRRAPIPAPRRSQRRRRAARRLAAA